MKKIKNYNEFANWIKSVNLDYEFETVNTGNDRIVIYNPNGSLSNDCISYTSNHPPKSWNGLKNMIQKIIKLRK